MGCGCGSGGAKRVTRYEVLDKAGKRVEDYPTRKEAVDHQARLGAGATIRPVVKQVAK